MKKFYFLVLLVFAGINLNAQITACNDPNGGIQIAFDDSQNCPAAPGELAGLAEIGFHSGANAWAATIDWNNAEATTGVNDGSDIFTVYIPDVDAYYGATVTEIAFVFNQGPANADAPWDSEGKPDDGAGGCGDFALTLADVTETCATTLSTYDAQLENDITIAPNPALDKVNIMIDNNASEIFTISLTTLTGQLVKTIENFNGSNYELQRGNLAAGIYFVKIQTESGKFATERVVFK